MALIRRPRDGTLLVAEAAGLLPERIRDTLAGNRGNVRTPGSSPAREAEQIAQGDRFHLRDQLGAACHTEMVSTSHRQMSGES
jgi:hypothetical protein